MIGYQLTIRAARDPHAVALVFGARRYTYSELNERACRLANGLAALGVGRGDRVAALLYNCNHFIEALFAAAKLGAVFAPINFRLVAREIGLQLEACTPKALLAGEDFGDVMAALEGHPALPRHVLRLNDAPPAGARESGPDPYEEWLAAQAANEPDTTVLPGNVLMLMHSSGTTGLPKGIVYTHATTHASSVAKIIDFGLTERDVSVVFGPLFHAGPLMDLALPLLLRGGRVVIGASRRFDPTRLLLTVAEQRGTVVPIYPTMLRRMVLLPDFSAFDLSSLRLIVTGGEPTPQAVIRTLHERLPGIGFVNNYGSTEGGPVTTFLSPQESRRRIGSVGRESFSVEVRIADGEGRPLPSGTVGEVLVRSPFVCRGYWNRPDLTAAAQRGGWWHTGDLAWRDEDGYLWIAGRSKDLIKSGTESIYPIEVEQVIATLEGVDEVSVIGVPDELWGESVAAFVVRRPGVDVDARRVIEHCRSRMAGYKKPRHVMFVDSLPRGATNKVSKELLRRQWKFPAAEGPSETASAVHAQPSVRNPRE